MKKREGRKWSGQTRGGRFGYRFFIFLLKCFGIRSAYAFLVLIVPYYIIFAPKATQSSWWYARRILCYTKWRAFLFLFKHYYSFGQALIDRFVVMSGMADRFHFEFGEGYDTFRSTFNAHQSLIVITAHMGSWEMGSPYFDDYGRDLYITLLDNEHAEVKSLIEDELGERCYHFLPLSESDGIANILRLKQVLDRNNFLCMQGDRYLSTSPRKLVKIKGMGAYLPIGPFLISSRLRVPLFFYFAMRERGFRYRFYFYEMPIGATQDELMTHYTQVLEELIEKYPSQWFNFYKFWE